LAKKLKESENEGFSCVGTWMTIWALSIGIRKEFNKSISKWLYNGSIKEKESETN
jgi:hypothetical protein